MTVIQAVNITLEIFNCAICFILLFCIMTDRHRKERLDKIFITLVSCHIPLLIVDMLIFTFEGNSEFNSRFAFRLLYFLSFTLGSLLILLFTGYLLTFIRSKVTISKNAIYISYLAIIICSINVIFIIITQFSGMYYTIGENNTVFPGEYYWLSQLLAMVCFFLNSGVMILYQKCFSRRETTFLLSYVALPAIALAIHNIVDIKTALLDVAITLTILVFYAGIQSEQSKQLAQKKLELTDARIAIMLSQIQPHFLFNSLVAIKQLCRIDPPSAETVVSEFAEFLRTNMDSITCKDMVPFKNELNHIKNYLSLEQRRFGDKIKVKYDIKADNFSLPPLSIQPIVENAIRYGITKKEEGGTVEIHADETDSHYVIKVIDDGVGFNTKVKKNDGRSHVGIENTRYRLKSMCSGSLKIESIIGEGSTVTINIPKPFQ